MKRQASILLALTLAACGGGADFTQANRPPVAQGGPNQTVAVGATVTLAGSGTDPDQDVLSYLWAFTRPDTSTTALSNTQVATPTFVADVAGTYTVALTVSDGKLTSPSSTVTITAQVQTAAFVKLWDGASCSDRRRIFLIDQHLVYTESTSLSCSDSNFYQLYESTPGHLLCTAGGFVAVQNCPGGAASMTMLQTIVSNVSKADLGLGSAHTVQQVYAYP